MRAGARVAVGGLLAGLLLGSGCGAFSFTDEGDFFYVENDGARLPVWVRGQRDASTFVVVLHGGPGSTSLQYVWLGAFAGLEEEYAVVLFDQRASGFARGQGPGGREHLSATQAATDVDAVLNVIDDLSEPERVVVLGHSWGGVLGTAFFATEPARQDRVDAWIEVDGGHNWALGQELPEPPPVPDGVPHHAVIVVIDTLRADALEEVDTPHFDALAERGSAVARAWSAGTWTAPSVQSLLLGASVRRHGWDLPFPKSRAQGSKGYPPMTGDHPTIAEVLDDAGFETSGYFANSVLRWDIGFSRGFDAWTKVRDDEMADAVADEVAGWREGERHLLYVHYRGPHAPVRPEPATTAKHGLGHVYGRRKGGVGLRWARHSAKRMRTYRKAYLAEVEDVDARLGALLKVLAPVEHDTMVVVTSDHGEMLGEHGKVGHEAWLHEALTHVPLLANVGGLPPAMGIARIPGLVLRHLGIDHRFPASSRERLPLAAQREGQLALSPDGVRKGVWRADGSFAGAWDVSADPAQERPLTGAEASLQQARAAWEAEVSASDVGPGRVPAGERLLQQLEELGYVRD